MLIDSHAHLTDDRYTDIIDSIINNLKNDGVEKVFTVAYSYDSIAKVIALCEKYEPVYGIIGIHPENSDEYNDDVRKILQQYSSHPKIIAIGEIGLDYHYDGHNKKQQEEIFVSQLKLANELQLPVVMHNRDSIHDMLEILKKHKHLLTHGGVMHCFSESVEIFKEIKKLGLKISIGGPLTFTNNVTAPAVCKYAELTDILLETDCPYLTPHPFRGKCINEPKFTRIVAQKLADIKETSIENVISQTTQNALDLFKKAKS